MIKKLKEVRKVISSLDRALVAFSGGVDSTLLALIAYQELGSNATAVIVKSPTLPGRELNEAHLLAKDIGIELLEMESKEMDLAEFQENTTERCYYCKNHRYDLLGKYANENAYTAIFDGSNADDLGDFRPGMRASQEQGVTSPLLDAGLTKTEIRTLAYELGLPNWNKPSSACLASRVPYGTPITADVIESVDLAEEVLHRLGIEEMRVRHHGDIARIEVNPKDFPKVLKFVDKINLDFREIGYQYITLDLQGFRSGSMNEGIDQDGSEKN